MSVPTSHPPIPRQPIGATFVVAISILAAVAVVQVLAVAVRYLPAIRQQVAESALQAQTPQGSPAPTPVMPQPAQQSSANTPPPAELLKAQKLLAEANRSFRVGDFDNALKTISDVEVIVPGDPTVLMLKAQILERLDQPAEAVMALEEALRYPGLPAEHRMMAEQKITQLSEVVARTQKAAPPTTSQIEYADPGKEDIRDSVGLQPGASLGIIDARLRDGKVGMKSLRVAVKARPGETINIPDVRIFIYFYEETEDGEIVITESKVNTQWMSPPVDWAADEPELLDGQYILPDSTLPGSSAANGAPGRKYHGFVVAVYYKNELQDFRSDPARLAKDFPLQLYLKEGGE